MLHLFKCQGTHLPPDTAYVQAEFQFSFLSPTWSPASKHSPIVGRPQLGAQSDSTDSIPMWRKPQTPYSVLALGMHFAKFTSQPTTLAACASDILKKGNKVLLISLYLNNTKNRLLHNPHGDRRAKYDRQMLESVIYDEGPAFTDSMNIVGFGPPLH